MTDLKKLKQLREETGVSFSLCKKALDESKDNIDQAKKKLIQWGAEAVSKKANRSTSQGGLFAYVHHNRKVSSQVELLCETDFVADNQDFQTLGQELSMQLASLPASSNSEFLEQEYIRDPSKKVSDLIKEAVMKFGENIKIGKMIRWELGEKN